MPRHLLINEAGLAEVAIEQDRVVSRRQLATVGVDRHAIAHRLRTEKWRAIGPHVVALTTGALTWRQRMWVAVLHSGPDSALAGLSAADAEGLEGFRSTSMHVVVPHGARAGSLIDQSAGIAVNVRQSRRLAEDALIVQPVRLPRRLRLAEAVVDAARAAATDERARLLVIAAVQQRLLLPCDLQGVVDSYARLRRRTLMSEAIADVEGGVHSLPEGDWTRAVRRYGLPEPARQQPIKRHDGTWYLDADFWPYPVAVEINGTQHRLAAAVLTDDHRRNVLGTGGRLVITIGSHIVRRRPGQAVVATAAGLMSRGWEPARQVRRGLERLASAERMDLETGDWLPRAS